MINENEIPTDIQIMINNNESGAALLRIVEVIGQDRLERMDEDTIYFIISALNQLNIDSIRNKILFKRLSEFWSICRFNKYSFKWKSWI